MRFSPDRPSVQRAHRCFSVDGCSYRIQQERSRDYRLLPSPGIFGSAVLRYEQPIGQSILGVRVLPARAGYLTRPDDEGGLVAAIREASTRWAGFSEPIVPVPDSGSVDGWWLQVLKLADLDGLVNVNIEPDVAERLGKTIGLPVVDLADIDTSGRTQFSTHSGNLPQTRPEFSNQAAVLARADGDLWEKTAAGDLTAEQEADCEGISTPVWRPRTADVIGRAQLDETCWLDVGAAHFSEHRSTNSPMATPAIVWVTEPTASRTVCPSGTSALYGPAASRLPR